MTSRRPVAVLTGWQFDETFPSMIRIQAFPAGKLETDFTQDPVPVDIATRHDPGAKTFSAAFQNQTITPFELAEELATKAAALKGI